MGVVIGLFVVNNYELRTPLHELTRNAIPSSVPASHGNISMSMSPAHVQFGRQRFNALTPENIIIFI